jgi:class 3 adenylate cyclase
MAAVLLGPKRRAIYEEKRSPQMRRVMFCDLVDSTGIAAKLNAEEWRDLVGAYLDAASAAVTEMGGKVAKKLGDGPKALFGYPLNSAACPAELPAPTRKTRLLQPGAELLPASDAAPAAVCRSPCGRPRLANHRAMGH